MTEKEMQDFDLDFAKRVMKSQGELIADQATRIAALETTVAFYKEALSLLKTHPLMLGEK